MESSPVDLAWLEGIFADPMVDELVATADGTGHLLRGTAWQRLQLALPTGEDFAAFLQDFALDHGQRLDPVIGSAGGLALGGICRWHALLPPLVLDGATLSIRRHRFEHLSLADFTYGSPDLEEKLGQALSKRRNLLIIGPTGAGKTSLLVALTKAYCATERIISLESWPELPLLTPLSLRLVTRRANLEGAGSVSIDRLLEEALRLRPDRLVLGEIRGAEARAFVELVATGHGGALGTMHAATPREGMDRLWRLAKLSPRNRPTQDCEPSMGACSSLLVAQIDRGRPPRIAALEPWLGCGHS